MTKKSNAHASMSHQKIASISLPSLHAPRKLCLAARLSHPETSKMQKHTQDISASNHYMKGWMVESDGEV